MSAVRATAERDAAALAVALDRQRAPVAALPGGAQRVREQRQGARLAGDVAQHEVDEAGLEPQPGQPRRLGDGPPQLGVGHRPEQDLLVGDRAGEAGMRAQLPVEVGAHADHDRAGKVEQRVDERRAAAPRRRTA